MQLTWSCSVEYSRISSAITGASVEQFLKNWSIYTFQIVNKFSVEVRAVEISGGTSNHIVSGKDFSLPEIIVTF